MGRRALGCRIVCTPRSNDVARFKIKHMGHTVKSLRPLWISSCNFFLYSSLSIKEMKVIKAVKKLKSVAE